MIKNLINNRTLKINPKKILLISLVSVFNFSALADNYPKAKFEREMDEMGSIIKGEGIVFRPNKVKNQSTKATIGNINKYLYKAAIDVLKFVPLVSADINGGMIITDWYSPKEHKDTQFKITVYIKDQLITPEALEVIAFQRKKINGKWQEQYETSPIASVFEDKILRTARQYYQDEKK